MLAFPVLSFLALGWPSTHIYSFLKLLPKPFASTQKTLKRRSDNTGSKISM